MLPRLFHIGSFSQSTYGVLVAAAFLIALSLTSRLARRAGLNSDHVVNLGILCGISAMVGAKIMMYLVDFSYYAEHPGEIFSLSSLQAGGVFYGGLIAALIAATVFMRRHRLPALVTADVFAPGIALGHAIGRLGCFAAGCCYGRPTHLPWGVAFTDPLAQIPREWLGIPLHPTQLYESAVEFIVFGILYWRIAKPHPRGAIIALYLILYSTARFLVEFVRDHGEEHNPFGGPLNTEQYISLALIGLAVVLLFRAPHAAKV